MYIYFFSTSIVHVVFYFKNVISKEAGWSTNYPSVPIRSTLQCHIDAFNNKQLYSEEKSNILALKFGFPISLYTELSF